MMQYVSPANQPPTLLVPEPPYVDGDGVTKGSTVPAKAIEHPMREVLAVISGAGLTPSEADTTQLWQAIQLKIAAMIAAAGGGGGGGGSADWSKNPIFPETISGGGLIGVTSSTGSVEIAAGQQFIWRGGVLINTSSAALAERQFATLPSKTYHLRAAIAAGVPTYALKDVADAGYNPGALAETAEAFDSKYDDMLIARVVTDASNVPTATAVINLNVMKASGTAVNARGIYSGGAAGAGYENGTAPNSIANYTAVALNFARRPQVSVSAINDVWALGGDSSKEFSAGARPLSRYQIAVWGQGDADIFVGWEARA